MAKDHISLGDQQVYYLQVFQDFIKHRKKTNRAVDFSCRSFPNILKNRTTDETFHQSGKQQSFRDIEESR